MLGNERMIQRRKSMHSAGFFDGDGIIRRHRYFEFQVNNTQTISGLFSTIAGQNISVDWGDGSARSTYSGTNQVWSKDYGSAGDRTVRIFGSVVLTKFVMDAGGADISFDIANAPTGLTYLNVGGSNTVSGDIANAPTGLTYLDVRGSNTVSGDIANAPTGLTYLSMWGSNTVSGDIANAPTGLTSLSMGGSNTIADYTGKTWTTKPTSFYLIPVGAGGLSTAEVDQLLIDFDDDLVWAAGNVITLTGANAARSAASDAAVASMVAEGATVTTN
jgi:hypothetical protein